VNDKLVNMVFKIGLLLIGMAFLVVYYFHSQNGRFYKIGTAEDYQVLDTRTGVVHAFWVHDKTSTGISMNLTNGKIKFYDPEVSNEQKAKETAAPRGFGAAPGWVPDAPVAPSTEDLLKGKQ